MLLNSIKINPEALDFKEPQAKSKEMQVTEEELLDMMKKVLEDPDFQEFIYDLTKEGHLEEASFYACVYATHAYLDYQSTTLDPLSPAEWFATPEGQEVVDELTVMFPEAITQDITEFLEKYGPTFIENFLYEFSKEVEEFINELFQTLLDDSGPSLIEFDEEKFSKSMGINITENDLNQLFLYLCGATEHTYQGNLADFGYDDLTDPVGITIYPKDYESKTHVVEIIDNYNKAMNESNEESKFVTYEDDASAAIDSAQIIISLVAAILISFLSSIFVSSTLLLAVIFGLSTVTRRREVGILRALGARKRDITRMFNCETVTVGLLSGIFGVAIALLICAIVNASSNLGFELCVMPFGGAVILIIISVLLMLIAGYIPAKIASKKDPVRAIRGL